MGQYLKYDLKRALTSKISKYYVFAVMILILVANVAVIAFRIIYGSNEGTFAYNVFEYATWCFLIPYYSCIVLGIAALGNERIVPRKDGVTVRCGEGDKKLPLWQLYVSKIVTACAIAAVYMIFAIIFLYIITLLFHLREGAIQWVVIRSFLDKVALSLPLWFAGICFAVMFLFVFEKKPAAIAGFAAVTVVIPQLIRIFSLDMFNFEFFRIIRRYTITQSFGLVPYPSYPERSVPLVITLGIVYGLAATAVGLVALYRKAE